MTKVMIFPVPIESGVTAYYAQAGDKQSVGETAGAALDAITTQLQDTDGDTVVVLQKRQPDGFFTVNQQKFPL